MNKRLLCMLLAASASILPFLPASQAYAEEQKPVVEAPASAAVTPLDEKGEHLKAGLAEAIDYYKTVQNATGTRRLETVGDLMVVKEQSYYTATLPRIIMVNTTTQDRFDLGQLKVNAIPGTDPQTWKVAVAVPPKLTVYDHTNKPRQEITIGQQKANGIFNEALSGFTKLDSSFSGINIRNLDDATTGTLESLVAKMNFTQGADGTWSGPSNILASNFTLNEAGNGAVGKIGTISLDAAISGYSFEDAKKHKQAILEMAEKLKAAKELGTQPDLSASLLSTLNAVGDASKVEIAFRDMELSVPAKDATPASSFKLQEFVVGTDLKDMKSDVANLTLKFGYNGLSVTPEGGEIAALVPTVLDFGIELQNIPTAKLAAGTGSPDLMEKVSLSNAGVSLKSMKVGNKDYMLDFTGALQSSAVPGGKATGQFNGSILGLQTLMAKIQTVVQSLPEDKRGSAMMIMMPISLVDSFGKADPSNPNLKTYDIQLKPEGLTVNGMPVGKSQPSASSQNQIGPVSAR